MTNQTIKLNMTPGGVPQVVYVSKYDVGRPIAFQLVEGRQQSPYTIPTGANAVLKATKPDDKGIAYSSADEDSPVTYSGSVVTFLTTEQFCAATGTGRGEIRIVYDGKDIGSANYLFVVEQEGISDSTDMSETEVPGLVALARQQVEDSEAWAKGTRNGEEVPSTDETYEDNSKYWAGQAEDWFNRMSEYGVMSFNDRAGMVTPEDGDYTGAMISSTITEAATRENLASGERLNVSLGKIKKWFSDLKTAAFHAATDFFSASAGAALEGRVDATQADLATIETSATAAHAYAVNDYLVYGGQLYKVTAAIAIGDTLTPGTNISSTTAGAELSELTTNLEVLKSRVLMFPQNYVSVPVPTTNGQAYTAPSTGVYSVNFYNGYVSLQSNLFSSSGVNTRSTASNGTTIFIFVKKGQSMHIWYDGQIDRVLFGSFGID